MFSLTKGVLVYSNSREENIIIQGETTYVCDVRKRKKNKNCNPSQIMNTYGMQSCVLSGEASLVSSTD